MEKDIRVKIGDFLFKYRNFLFPLMLVAMFVVRPPIYEYAGVREYEHIKDYIAIGIVIFGLLIRAAVIGFAYIKRGGLNKKVYADKLVVEGFFAVCRNPLYVGNIAIYAGVFLMHGDPVIFVVGNLLFLFIYHCIVRAEEFFLRNKFGADFDAYCAEVPRWWPKLGRLKAATKGMKFNFKRVLAKDYSTIMNAVFTITLIEMYEEILFYKHVHYVLFAVIILLTTIAGLGTRHFKKSGQLNID